MHQAHFYTASPHSERLVPWYPEWTSQAACLDEDPEIFFPTGKGERKREKARKVCEGCPVRLKCLKQNLLVPYGIFGGYTATERYKLRFPNLDRPDKRFGSSYFGDFFSVSPRRSSSARPGALSRELLLTQLSGKLSRSSS